MRKEGGRPRFPPTLNPLASNVQKDLQQPSKAEYLQDWREDDPITGLIRGYRRFDFHRPEPRTDRQETPSTFRQSLPSTNSERLQDYAPTPQSNRQDALPARSYYGGRFRARVGEGFTERLRLRKRVVTTRNTTFGDEDESMLDDEEYAARRVARKEKAKKTKQSRKESGPPTPIFLPEFISVSNLAMVLKMRLEDFMRKVVDMGFGELSYDHVIDAETAGLMAAEFNFEPITEQTEEKDIKPQPLPTDRSLLPQRPPIVTIMGHVDHGKTTMLDFLRKSSVAASEHGGITQHIGAFSVPMSGGRLVTFLDTPGHEAFLSMRQRGANVTDIVILVVAADDSVKPQTIEAIKHAQAANVPMIVAVNKIDKEGADMERVKQDVSRQNVQIEDYGGDTQVVGVSGKTGQGMAELEDAIVALADILDMRAESDGLVEGWVLEAATSKAQGRQATVLIRRGTLRPGDVIVAGTSWARVRSLKNEAGVLVESAGPGTPVEIDGWREEPTAGDEVLQAPDEQRARSVMEYRLQHSEQEQLAKDVSAVNENRRYDHEKRRLLKLARDQAEANGQSPDEIDPDTILPPRIDSSSQDVYFIVKADVSGSAEAIVDAISSLGNNEIRPYILRTGIGSITEFDIDHAAAAKGLIINFNTASDASMQRLAEARGVRILDHSIIYRLVDDVRVALQDRLPPVITQRVLGEADIGQVFSINVSGRKQVPVAGCTVRNGDILRKERVRVLRDREVIYTGKLN